MLIEPLSNNNAFVSPQNTYKYQDKELVSDLNLNMEDFGLRQYDPVIGRWNVPDPMMQEGNPYVAMGNNPVSMSDPSGGWALHTNSGNYINYDFFYNPQSRRNESLYDDGASRATYWSAHFGATFDGLHISSHMMDMILGNRVTGGIYGIEMPGVCYAVTHPGGQVDFMSNSGDLADAVQAAGSWISEQAKQFLGLPSYHSNSGGITNVSHDGFDVALPGTWLPSISIEALSTNPSLIQNWAYHNLSVYNYLHGGLSGGAGGSWGGNIENHDWTSVASGINGEASVAYETTSNAMNGAQALANQLGHTNYKLIEAGGKNIAKGFIAVDVGLTAINFIQNGPQWSQAADLGIDAAIYGIAELSGPAGWIVGATYYFYNEKFKSTHGGHSMTEYYFNHH